MLVGEVAFKLAADTAAFSRAMTKAAADVRALKASIGDLKLTVDIDVDKNAFRQKVRAAVASSSQNQIKVDLEIDSSGFRRQLRQTVASAQGNAVKVDLSLDEGGFRDKVKAAVSGAGGQNVKADLDLDESGFREKVRAAISGASGSNIKVDFDVNVSRLRTQVREATSTTHGNAIKVDFDLDTGRLRTQVREATKTAAGNAIKVNFDVDRAQLRGAITAATAGLDIKIPIHVDSTGFRSEVRRAVDAAQAGQKVNVPINTGSGGGGGGSSTSSITSGGGAAASAIHLIGMGAGIVVAAAAAFSTLASAIASCGAAAVGLASALGPVMALLGGGMLAGGAGILAVFGSIATAVKGPIGALKAISQEQKTQTTNSGTAAKAAQAHADAVASASRSVRSAQDGVSQAYKQAGRAAVDSAAAVTSAQNNLKQTVSDVADANAAAADRVSQAVSSAADANAAAAQKTAQAEMDVHTAESESITAQMALNDARKQAVVDIDNMRRALRMTSLDERGAVLDVQDALDALNQVKMNSAPDTMAFKRAQLTYDRSVANLDDIRNRLKQEQTQVAYNAKTGVDGQKSVQDANTTYLLSLGKVYQAQDALKLAQQDQAKVAVKGQQDIAAAQREQAKTAVKGQQQIADAQQSVAKAIEDQRRSAEDSAHSIAQAQQGLADAQAALAKAMADTGDAGSTAADKVGAAMAKLSPAAQEFVNKIQALKPAWEDIQKSSQQALFPGVNDAIDSLTTTLPTLKRILTETSTALGGLASDFGAMFASSAWQADLAQIGHDNALSLEALGQAGLHVFDAFRNVAAVAAPMVTDLARLAEQTTRAWDAQIKLKRASGELQATMERGQAAIVYTGRSLGALWDIVKNLGKSGGTAIGIGMFAGMASGMKNLADKVQANQDKIRVSFYQAMMPMKAFGELLKTITIESHKSMDFASLTVFIDKLRTDVVPAFFKLQSAMGPSLMLALADLVTGFLQLLSAMPIHPLTIFIAAIAQLTKMLTSGWLGSITGPLLAVGAAFLLLKKVVGAGIVIRVATQMGSAPLIGGALTSLVGSFKGLGSKVGSSFMNALNASFQAGHGMMRQLGSGLLSALTAAVASPAVWVVAAAAIAAGIFYIYKTGSEKAKKEAAAVKAEVQAGWSNIDMKINVDAGLADPQKAIHALVADRQRILDATNLVKPTRTLNIDKALWEWIGFKEGSTQVIEPSYYVRAAFRLDPTHTDSALQGLVTKIQNQWNVVMASEHGGQYDSNAVRILADYEQSWADQTGESVKKIDDDIKAANEAINKAWADAMAAGEAAGIGNTSTIFTYAAEHYDKTEATRVATQAIDDVTKIKEQVRTAYETAFDPGTWLTSTSTLPDGSQVSNALFGPKGYAAYAQTLKTQMQTLGSDASTALAAGYDPGIVSSIMKQAPDKAAEAMHSLVGDTTAGTVQIVNDAYQQLQRFTNLAVEQAGLVQIASESHGTLTRPQAELGGRSALDIQAQARQIRSAHRDWNNAQIAAQLKITPGALENVQRGFGDLDVPKTTEDWKQLTAAIWLQNDAVITYARNIQDGTATQELWRGTIDATGAAMGNQYRAILDQTGSQATANASIKESITTMMEFGKNVGMSTSQVLAYISQVTGIPVSVLTTVTADTQNANDRLAAVNGQVITLPGGKTVTIHGDVQDAITKLQAAGLQVNTLPDGTITITGDASRLNETINNLDKIPMPTLTVRLNALWNQVGWNAVSTVTGGAAPTPATQRRATGGWISGPGTSTSDSIPARLSAGEYVVNARSASQHAGLLQQINGMANGGVVGRDGVLGFAGGGSVVATPSANGLTISGDISPFSVVFNADVSQVYATIGAFHPVAWLVLVPDFTQVYAAAAAFHPVAWLVLVPDFSQVYTATAAFKPVAWLTLSPDFAQVYTGLAAFHPVAWLSLSIDPTAFLSTLDAVVVQVSARMQQLVGSENFMATGVEGAIGRAIAAHTRFGASTDSVTFNTGIRLGQIVASENNMATGVEGAVNRAIAANTRQGASIDSLSANTGMRMGQIIGSANNMAGTTEGASARVVGAYARIQGRVDAMHGKTFDVVGNAKVTLPDSAQLAGAVKKASDIIVGVVPGATLVANGMIFSRANGGVDNLPGHAKIESAKGPGLVNWAEGETGGEAFIPLSTSKRARSLAIWQRTGQLLGAFASGGLLGANTKMNAGNADAVSKTQPYTDDSAKVLGKAALGPLQKASSSVMAQVLDAVMMQGVVNRADAGGGSAGAANGPDLSGGPAGSSYPLIEQFMNTSGIPHGVASTYRPPPGGYHSSGMAVDFVGNPPTYPSTQARNNMADIAKWWFQYRSYLLELIHTDPNYYVKNSQVISSYGAATDAGHRDHIHVAASVAAMNTLLKGAGQAGGAGSAGGGAQLASNVSGVGTGGGNYGKTSGIKIKFPAGWGGAGGALGSAVGGAGGDRSAINMGSTHIYPSGAQWTRPQMYQALLGAGLPASAANILAAIGMRENSGGKAYAWSFPSVNPTGTYHSAWAMQEASHPGADFRRMDTDINYAASLVAKDYRAQGLRGWTMDNGAPPTTGLTGIADGIIRMAKGGVVPGAGHKDSVPALLTPGELVVPKQMAAANAGSATATNDSVGQIIGDAGAMAGEVEGAVNRVIAAHARQNASVDSLAANTGTRVTQVVAAHTQQSASVDALAVNTDNRMGQVIGAYSRMQGRVDSLHGKGIRITSVAGVDYSKVGSALAEAVKAMKAVAVANGMIFKRANGSIDNLPGHAQIATGRGAGLVNWAEKETGGEAFIPLATSKRARSMAIWERTGQLLGAYNGGIKMAQGGLVDADTSHADGNWHPKTAQLQIDTEAAATQFGEIAMQAIGKISNDKLAEVANAKLDAVRSVMSAAGPGYSIGGNWAPNVRPWVEYIARSNNISAMTYAGHHPAENYAVDLALGQDGMKNTAPGIGPSGNDLYSKVASWVDQHVISAASPGWYVGTHAGIKSRGGGWHPAASQVGRRGQTFAHDDHVHVSFDPRGGVPMVGVPGNSSLPGFNWDHGGAPPKAEMPVGGGGGGGGSAGPPGNYATFSGYLGMHWTQAALEASVRKMGGNPGVAHVLGAIAMAEAMPIGKFIGNNTGMYTGAWAFQRAWAASMYDWNRLSNDLDYDSMAALRLYNAPGPGGFGATHMKWETWPGAASKFMGDGGILKMNSGGIVEGPATGIDSVPAMLSPGELVVPAPAVKQQAHRPRFQSFAAGGVVPLDFTWGGYKTTPGSGYNKATGFMKGFWSTAGNWTDMASLSKEMTALAASYKMVLSHEIRGLSNSAQFIHLSHYPAVVAVLKHMADLTKSGRLQKTAGHYTLNGKRIPGMAMGGVAGDGLAQLHAGEYVVSAPAARRYGPLLTSINAKRGSAAPSIYSPSTASSAGSGSAAPTVTHNWTVAVAPDAKPRTVARELAWEFAGARGA